MTNESNQSRWYRSPFAWIMGGLLAWGTYLAVGSYLAGGSMAIWRGVLIFVCTVLFLLIWLAVLYLRKQRNPDR